MIETLAFTKCITYHTILFNSLKWYHVESWTWGHYGYLFKYSALGRTYTFKYLVTKVLSRYPVIGILWGCGLSAWRHAIPMVVCGCGGNSPIMMHRPWVLFSLGTTWTLSCGTARLIRIYSSNAPSWTMGAKHPGPSHSRFLQQLTIIRP